MEKVYQFIQNKITASYVIRVISLLILPLLNLGGVISPVAAQSSENATYKESSAGIYTGPIIDMHLHSYSADEKADIFYSNAARFLGLGEEEITQHHAKVDQDRQGSNPETKKP